MINRRWWVYPSARSMWRPLARRADREKSTNTARVRCLDTHWHMIPTTLDGSLGQTACERLRVPVWVRAAVLTERIRAAGAPKVTSHVVFSPLLLRGRLHGDFFFATEIFFFLEPHIIENAPGKKENAFKQSRMQKSSPLHGYAGNDRKRCSSYARPGVVPKFTP